MGDAVSHVDVHLPIYAALAGVDVNQGETGTIDLEGDLFLVADDGHGTTAVATASSHLDDFVPFTRLRLSDLRARLESLRDDWFDTLAASDSFNVAIPFINASLADVVDLGAAFDLAVLSKIDFAQIHSLQDFVAVVTASGLLPDGQAITYNTATRTLAVPLDFEIELSGLSLRDLDALGRINLQLLANEGLVQIGSYVDPDDLLDHGYLTLAGLVGAGILGPASVENWEGIDIDALIDAGVITQAAWKAKGLIQPGDVVDMDALIDEGLVTLGDLIEAGLVTTGTLVGNLGFIRDLNLLGSNVADLGADLTSRISVQDLVNLDDLLGSGVASLGELFDTGLLDLGDLNVSSLGINDLISSGAASLQELVGQELVAATDFLSSTLVDIGDLLTDTAMDLGDLLGEGLLSATDFDPAALIGRADVFTHGVATLAQIVQEDLVSVDDFVNITLHAADLISNDLATQFQLDYNDLDDGLGNISLHELVNSGVASLDELVREGLIAYTNLVPGSFSLDEPLDGDR